MPRFARLAAGIALVVPLLASGCASPKAAAPSTEDSAEGTSVPQQKIVFDMAHGEIFGPDDTTELGQSQAIAQMRSSGFDVVVNSDQITAEDLARLQA